MCDRQDHKMHFQPNEDALGNSGDGAWTKMPNAKTDYDSLRDPTGRIDLCDMSTAQLIRAAVTAGCNTLSWEDGRSTTFSKYSIWLASQ